MTGGWNPSLTSSGHLPTLLDLCLSLLFTVLWEDTGSWLRLELERGGEGWEAEVITQVAPLAPKASRSCFTRTVYWDI